MSITLTEQSRIATIRAIAPQSFDSSTLTQELIDSGASPAEARARFKAELARHTIRNISNQAFADSLGFDAAGLNQCRPDAKPMSKGDEERFLSMIGQ